MKSFPSQTPSQRGIMKYAFVLHYGIYKAQILKDPDFEGTWPILGTKIDWLIAASMLAILLLTCLPSETL